MPQAEFTPTHAPVALDVQHIAQQGACSFTPVKPAKIDAFTRGILIAPIIVRASTARSGGILAVKQAYLGPGVLRFAYFLLPLFYPHESVAQAVTLPLKGQQVTMMCQAVNHSRSHLVIGKDGAPLGKLQIGGNDETPALVAA